MYTKPAPEIPFQSPVGVAEPYRDEHSPVQETSEAITAPRPKYSHGERATYFPPYRDASPILEHDDVPLALFYPHPAEAPPPYSVVVRESYRDTLTSHIPSEPLLQDGDQEQGETMVYPDDIRFSVEGAVAKFIVALVLLTITGVLVFIAINKRTV